MKKNIFSLLLISVFSVLSAFTFAQDSNGAKIAVVKDLYDFGNIKNGANGTCVFEYTNTGNAPLIISSVKTSCSCMVADWSKEPLAPGNKGIIRVKYDTKRPGPINKSVTVTSNAANEPTKTLKIRGNVAVLAEDESPVINSGTPANN